MPTPDQHVSHRPGELESAAFHAQLRRLESLQTLMTQGGTVVGEVAQFLVRAREELSVFQTEQERYASAQSQLLEEKQLLAEKVSEMQRAMEEGALRAAEQDVVIQGLRTELATRNQEQIPGDERAALLQESEGQKARLAEALTEITRLTEALKAERSQREDTAGRIRSEVASDCAREIALLKDRLTALEAQLEAERQRRSRLMEVVKTHDVTVGPKLPEPA